MEPADLRDGDDPATWRGFDDSWLGTVVVKRLVWPHGVVVGEVRPQETTQMSVIENEEMVEALSSNRADDPLCEGILPGRAGGGEDLASSHTLDSPRELLAVDRVSITEQEPGNRIVRECLDDLPGGAPAAPRWILASHTPDQTANFKVEPRAADRVGPGLPPPVELEAFPVPGQNRSRLNDDETGPPARPQAGEPDPDNEGLDPKGGVKSQLRYAARGG